MAVDVLVLKAQSRFTICIVAGNAIARRILDLTSRTRSARVVNEALVCFATKSAEGLTTRSGIGRSTGRASRTSDALVAVIHALVLAADAEGDPSGGVVTPELVDRASRTINALVVAVDVLVYTARCGSTGCCSTGNNAGRRSIGRASRTSDALVVDVDVLVFAAVALGACTGSGVARFVGRVSRTIDALVVAVDVFVNRARAQGVTGCSVVALGLADRARGTPYALGSVDVLVCSARCRCTDIVRAKIKLS